MIYFTIFYYFTIYILNNETNTHSRKRRNRSNEDHGYSRSQTYKRKLVIRVKAAGLNFADILARQGLYPDAPKVPAVMGYEVSGIVEAVGEDVDICI